MRYLVLYLILIFDSLTVLLASLAHCIGLLDQNGECNTHTTLRYWLFDPEMVIRIRVWFKNISLISSIWFISKIPKIFGCFLTFFSNNNFYSQSNLKEFIGRFYFNPIPSGSLLKIKHKVWRKKLFLSQFIHRRVFFQTKFVAYDYFFKYDRLFRLFFPSTTGRLRIFYSKQNPPFSIAIISSLYLTISWSYSVMKLKLCKMNRCDHLLSFCVSSLKEWKLSGFRS